MTFDDCKFRGKGTGKFRLYWLKADKMIERTCQIENLSAELSDCFPRRLGAKAASFSLEFTMTEHDKPLLERLAQETLSQCS